MATRNFFQKHVPASGKFPRFKATELVKALQIANENGWNNKALLIFEHLVEAHAVTSTPDVGPLSQNTLKIHEKLSQNCKLNFGGQLGNVLEQSWRPCWGLTESERNNHYSTLLGTKIHPYILLFNGIHYSF
jgi:hypothetical protein